jgi:hypothetical protein
MNNTELESYVTLRFYPPQATDEYVDTIPDEVQVNLLAGTYLLGKFKSSYRGSLKHYIQIFCTSPEDAHGLKYLWIIIKPHLLRYYEHHGT